MSWPNGKLMTCYPTSCVEALTPATYSPKVNKNTIFSWFLVVCGRLVHGHPNLFSYLGLTVHPRFSLHVYRFLWSYIGPSSVISGLFPPDMIYKWNLKVKIPVATLRPFRGKQNINGLCAVFSHRILLFPRLFLCPLRHLARPSPYQLSQAFGLLETNESAKRMSVAGVFLTSHNL